MKKEIYNLRIGDLLYTSRKGHPIVGLVYKLTLKYAYYAVCASSGEPGVNPWISKGNRTSKEKIYKMIKEKNISISYSGGTKRRRLINLIES